MTLRLADNTLYFIIHYQRLWAHYGLTSFPEECSHTEDSVSGGHIFYLKKKRMWVAAFYSFHSCWLHFHKVKRLLCYE